MVSMERGAQQRRAFIVAGRNDVGAMTSGAGTAVQLEEQGREMSAGDIVVADPGYRLSEAPDLVGR
jgi:hypothetical protein